MGIALHQGFAVFLGKAADGQAIDQHKIGGGVKLEIGQAHGFIGRLQNVDPVNHFRLDAAEADSDRFGLNPRFGPLPADAATGFLESRMPSKLNPGGRTTQAASTGPASGPRPTSSIPRHAHEARAPRKLLVLPERSSALRCCAQRMTPRRDGGQKMNCARPTTRCASSGPHCVPSLLSLRLSPIIR